MLYGTIIFFHILVCIGLILVVLVQAGRGGGLAESFSGAESILGTKTNAFLTKATTIFAVAFFITCLSLTFVSKQCSQSLLEGKNIKSSPAKKVQEKKEPATPAEGKRKSQSRLKKRRRIRLRFRRMQPWSLRKSRLREEPKALPETQK